MMMGAGMFATTNKNRTQLAVTFMSLLFLSACAGRGGVQTDNPSTVTDEELGIVTAEEPVAAEVETEQSAAGDEYPTLFNSPYLVKGTGDHELKAKWSAQISGDKDLLLHFRPAMNGDLACAAGRGAVHCFDRNSGKKQWRRKVRDLASGVSFSNKSVLVGTDEGEVIALSRENGAEQWRTIVGGEVLALAAVGQAQVGEVIVAYTSSGTLTGLRGHDGETIWVQEQKVPRLTLRGLATPLIVDDLVLIGHDNGRITANQLLDGSSVWADEVVSPTGRNELERLADVDGALAHYRGDVFAASWGGKMGAWSAKRGRPLWKADIASVTGVAADLRRVYVTDTSNALHALDTRSGRVLWKREDLVPEDEADERRVVATTTALGGPLVLDNYGRLYYYNRATGDLDFAKTITGEYIAAPAVDAEQVLTLSRNGLLSMWHLLEAK
jgi:outer membrane protein assembly factor BamB